MSLMHATHQVSVSVVATVLLLGYGTNAQAQPLREVQAQVAPLACNPSEQVCDATQFDFLLQRPQTSDLCEKQKHASRPPRIVPSDP